MERQAPTGVTTVAGLAPGWRRVAETVAAAMPADAIDRIWLFAPVRQEDREWGTAVISCRREGGRRRIYTATYLFVVRGRERGQGRVDLEEVGESPTAVVHEVIEGVRERAGDGAPPIEIAPDQWYGDDEPTTQG